MWPTVPEEADDSIAVVINKSSVVDAEKNSRPEIYMVREVHRLNNPPEKLQLEVN